MDYRYLDDERKKLWQRLDALEKLVKTKQSENEIEIREILENAKDHIVEIESVAAAVQANSSSLQVEFETIKSHYAEIYQSLDDIASNLNKAVLSKEEIASAQSQVEVWKVDIEKIHRQIGDFFSGYAEIEAGAQKVKNDSREIDELLSKIKATHKSVIDRSQKVDDIYYEMVGYDDTDDAGNKTHIEGKKVVLDEAYNRLVSDFSEHEAFTLKAFEEMYDKMNSFIIKQGNEFDIRLKAWDESHDRAVWKINELLPNALTAGLSYAFSDKKQQELDEHQKYAKSFRNALFAMAVISLLPISISVVSLLNNVELSDVVSRFPSVVLGFFPLYLPALWFAYSVGKKLNLSKRLIEEYSHKEALSKTYEGLAHQVEELSKTCNVDHLKEKLLFNVLDMSSENPGKLILNYDKSDHPLMDALDKSVIFANSVERLSRLPGFSRMAKNLSDKADKILQKEAAKSEKAIDSIDENEAKS